MNDLIRNGLVWLIAAAVFLALRLMADGQTIATGFAICAFWLFVIAAVQVARGLLQERN